MGDEDLVYSWHLEDSWQPTLLLGCFARSPLPSFFSAKIFKENLQRRRSLGTGEPQWRCNRTHLRQSGFEGAQGIAASRADGDKVIVIGRVIDRRVQTGRRDLNIADVATTVRGAEGLRRSDWSRLSWKAVLTYVNEHRGRLWKKID